jgi:hypothetical protein
MTDPASAAQTLGELRAERNRLHEQEEVVSYARRLAQGRLDLVRAEREMRARRESRDISGELPSIMGRLSGGASSSRRQREIDVPADHPLLTELDRICRPLGFDNVKTCSDDQLLELRDVLTEYEHARSMERQELFERIDELTADLVRRYQLGAPIEGLLDDTSA